MTHGRFDRAGERLGKLFEDPGSLWRGRDGPYARVGETLRTQGEGYRELVIPETHATLALLHSMQGDAGESLRHAKAAVAAGVPIERIIAGPRDGFGALHASAAFREWIGADPPILIHGPMLGDVTHDAASFWVRTAKPATVELRLRAEGGGGVKSASGTTSQADDFTGVVRVDGLAPDTRYRYELWVDGRRQATATNAFATQPRRGHPGRIDIVFTACAGYAPEHERIWRTLAAIHPRAVLMLGDNVYIDDPEHSLTQRFCYYRRFSRPEWRELVGATGVYAIWDDHDFGMDDSFGGPDPAEPGWKVGVWEVFKQNWNNPAYGGGDDHRGVWFDFHIGDVHFIMLDGRYYREPNARHGVSGVAAPSMLGPVQLAWLKETLKSSDATFRVIASPVPWADGSVEGRQRFDKWEGYPEERDAIFDFLHQERIDGVVLISGDRHRSDARIIRRANGDPLFEFMSAIPTNYHTHPVVDGPGLLFGTHQNNTFGVLRFDTALEDPTARFEIVDIDGVRVWSHDLRLSELRN